MAIVQLRDWNNVIVQLRDLNIEANVQLWD